MTDIKSNITPIQGEVLSKSSSGSIHRVCWTEWGNPNNPRILFCAHGLSRNARDFDYLAAAVGDQYRVICPDYPGRGASDWLRNKAYYNNEQYLKDSLAIIDRLEFDQLDWVGTSMGGLIGMMLAAVPNNPISKMIINDVGPYIPATALSVIGEYLKCHPRFNNHKQAIDYFKSVYAGFGKLDEEHYEHFVTHGVCASEDSDDLVLNYDPAIIDQFVAAKLSDIDIWDTWDKISVPILILRGKQSGLLLAQTVEQMKHRHGNAISVEFNDCAHAPSLMVEHQIQIIFDWLLNDSPANQGK